MISQPELKLVGITSLQSSKKACHLEMGGEVGQTSFYQEEGVCMDMPGAAQARAQAQGCSLETWPGMLTELGLEVAACWAWKAAAHQK